MTDAPLSPAELSRVREAFFRVPFVRLLNINLGEVGRGAATLHMDARPELTQVNGIMHGGALASLMDTAAAFAVLSTLESGQTTATVDFTIHYLRPVVQGKVTSHARILRAGRRLVTVAVEATDATGALTATALTTYAKKS